MSAQLAVNALIGRTLGGYRITAQIGKGGMATVFQAYQPSLDRYVAVKVMPPFYAEQDDTFLKRFRREAKAIASLRHPNILIVLDYGEQDGTTYIVMEYVESGTLTDLMGQPFPPDRMSNLIEQVAGALDYAHQSGVVHRDIKPSNILLPKPDWPLLTDFGLAKIVGGSQLTQSGTIAGTPAYMSPEQGRGDQIDSRSDIYSLGIVLYEMATGAVPFQAETPMAIVVKHIIDPLPLPRSRNPDLPESIERVILKALAKEPADRYQHAGELAAALNEAVGGLIGIAGKEASAATTVEELPVAAAAEAAAAATPAGAHAADAVSAGAPAEPAAGAPSRMRGGLRIGRWQVFGGLVALGAIVAFGAWRLLGGEPAADQQPGLSIEQPARSGPVDGRTTQQLIDDAQGHYEAGEFELALREVEIAEGRDPHDADQWVQIAELYMNLGDHGRAVGAIEVARSLDPEYAWAHEAAGYIYQRLEDHAAAVEAFERALEFDPGALWVYLGLTDSRLALGELRAAREATQRALESGAEDDPDLLDTFGWLYLDSGVPEQAEVMFALLAERHPGDPRGAYGLAEVQIQLGNVAGAIAILEPAAERMPESWIFESLAGWHLEIGQVEPARRAFEKAIELDPAAAFGAYGGLASLLVDQGQPDEAEELIRRAIGHFPQEAQLRAELGHLLMSLERPEEAIGPYQQAIELDPENGYRYVELAMAFGGAGQQSEAVRMLDLGAERASGDPWLHEAVGWGYAELARCDLALNHFELALELVPEMESALEGLRACGG